MEQLGAGDWGGGRGGVLNPHWNMKWQRKIEVEVKGEGKPGSMATYPGEFGITGEKLLVMI